MAQQVSRGVSKWGLRAVHKENDADLNCPQWGFYVGLISAVVSFFGADSFYSAAEDYLLAGVSNSLIVIAVKMGLFLSYLIPIAIGVFLLRSKQAIIQVVGCLFAGIGCGIVFRIALQFVDIINPYKF